MKTVVLIPWRPKDDRRRQLWDWTRYFLDELGWPIFTGDDGVEPFSRAAAVNAASERAGTWDVALIGDSDTVQQVRSAHEAAPLALEHGLAIPWTRRLKLSQRGTALLVQKGPEAVKERVHRDPRDGTSPNGGGATVMVSREAWETVGGMDPVFRGYGNEDLAFGAALHTLYVKHAPRIEGTVWHLWHRPQMMVGTARAATLPNRERWELYQRAQGNPVAMRELVSER